VNRSQRDCRDPITTVKDRTEAKGIQKPYHCHQGQNAAVWKWNSRACTMALSCMDDGPHALICRGKSMLC
jgi:hypothetical protein